MTEAEWLASDDPAAMLRLVTENPDHQEIQCCRSDRKLRLWVEACRAHSGASDYVDDLCTCYGLRVALEYWGSRDGTSVPQAVRARLLRDIVGTPHRPVALAREYRQCCGRKWPAAEGPQYCPSCGDLAACGVVFPDYVTTQILSLAHAAYDSRDPGRPHKKCRCGRNFARLQKKGLSPPLAWCDHCAEDGGWWADAVAREPDGTLDPARLVVLADALEEAGCPSHEHAATPVSVSVYPKPPAGWVVSIAGDHLMPNSPREVASFKRREAAVKAAEATYGVEWGSIGPLGGYGNGKEKVGLPHPLLAHLRSPGPHVRGCWAVDLLTGRE